MNNSPLHDVANDNDATATGKHASARTWKWLTGIFAIVALSAMLLGGTAFAASGTNSTLGVSFIDKLAQNLGISSTTLQTKITDSANQTIDAALAAGTITQAQADAMKQRIASGDASQLVGGIFDEHGHGGHIDLSTVAATLGMRETDLQTALSSGTTLTAIITQHGKTVDDVVSALVAQEKTELDARVAAGQITQTEADGTLSALPQQLTDAINTNQLGGHPGRPNDNDADDAPSTSTSTSATPTT